VVWWINGYLLPKIYVERGKSYAFRVQGGNNPARKKSFHPLYITDHPEGGYGLKVTAEKKLETIYAGVDNFGGAEHPTGAGPLCEYVPKSGEDKAAESETFRDYFRSLDMACERKGEYGWVNWTVGPATPDLVYYQGWNSLNSWQVFRTILLHVSITFFVCFAKLEGI
jgi:hypothetical protein